jgi:oxygen-dependent protoporphyrinogen oxidase
MKKHHIVIVGGGISGLSAAFFLSRKFLERSLPVRITILEAKDRFGGVLRSFAHEGLWVEAGADAFYAGRGETGGLCRALGLEPELVEAPSCFRQFYFLKNKKYFPAPGLAGSSAEAFLFLRSPALGWAAKCRILGEPFIPRRREAGDESLESFIRRRLGKSFYQEIAEPLIRGVYMADPSRLSLAATFPHLREAERTHGSLALSFIKKGPGKEKKKTDEFFTLKNGLESLARALVQNLKDCDLRFLTAARQCAYDREWELHLENGETLHADALCLAMNACGSAKLLQGAAPDLFRELSAIRYDSIATVSFAYRIEDVPDVCPKAGFLVPAPGVSCPFASLKWIGPSEDGKTFFLRAFLSDAMLPEFYGATDPVLEQAIRNSLKDFFGIQAAPRFLNVEHYPSVLPQYETGHSERVARIETMLRRHSGLYLTGNGFHGFGITDCVRGARNVADRIFHDYQSLVVASFCK